MTGIRFSSVPNQRSAEPFGFCVSHKGTDEIEWLVYRDSTNRAFVKRAFGLSQNLICHNLGVCHAQAARHRHIPGALVKASATLKNRDSAIRTDLHSLFVPSLRTNQELL